MVIPRDSFSAGDRFYPGDSSLGIWSLSPSDRQDPVWFARKWTRNGRKWLRKSLPRPAFVPRSLRLNCSLTSVLISWCAAGGNFRVDDVKHFENFIDAAIEFEISNLKMCTVIPRCYAQRRSFRYECIILSLSLSLSRNILKFHWCCDQERLHRIERRISDQSENVYEKLQGRKLIRNRRMKLIRN